MKIKTGLTPQKLQRKTARVFELAGSKIRSIDASWDPARGTPVFTWKGGYTSRGWTEWTQGFQFGMAFLHFDATGDEEFRPHLKRGYEYYRGTFFGSDGRPAYYHNRRHPVDIQCAAQAIDTFCLFADADAGALPRARLIAEWTIRNMQEPDGHFIHRRYPLLRAATPYFHWGQATMFHALAHLIFQCARRPVATLS